MTDEPATKPDDDEPDFGHEHEIVSRMIDQIAPKELPCDVDPAAVAFFLWDQLTDILVFCGWSKEDLLKEVSQTVDEALTEKAALDQEDLADAQPQGNA